MKDKERGREKERVMCVCMCVCVCVCFVFPEVVRAHLGLGGWDETLRIVTGWLSYSTHNTHIPTLEHPTHTHTHTIFVTKCTAQRITLHMTDGIYQTDVTIANTQTHSHTQIY